MLRFTIALSALTLTVLALPGRADRTPFAPQDLQPGRIIERVACQKDPAQSYALYLPSNYSSTRKWALLAAFDPGARGNAPLESFKEASERHGYIVCGSNNSRNGPLAPSAEAAKAMLADVAARFAIDEKRVYLTGFSGGGRAATAIAVWLTGQVAGVIGCGAGLAVGIAPSSSLPFVYYGTVGTEDFNYPEMKQLDRALDSAGVAHRIEVFEGGHGWPPAEVCVRATEWMELQAMKSGRRSRDDSFIDRLLKNAQDNATASEAAGRVYEAYIGYSGIAADFSGLKDVSDYQKKAALIKNSKPVKQAIGKDRDQELDQQRAVTALFNMRASLTSSSTGAADPETRQITSSDLKGKLAELKRKSEAKESTPERALARRTLNQFLLGSFEQAMTLLQTKRYDLAAENLALDAELMPDNWRPLYNLACAYALKGDKRRAIETLNKAVKKGFTNAAQLERDEQFDAIREEEGFKKIVEALKKQ